MQDQCKWNILEQVNEVVYLEYFVSGIFWMRKGILLPVTGLKEP